MSAGKIIIIFCICVIVLILSSVIIITYVECDHSYAHIKFKLFKQLYETNKNAWDIDKININIIIYIPDSKYFNFGFIDYYKSLFFNGQLKARKEEKEIRDILNKELKNNNKKGN